MWAACIPFQCGALPTACTRSRPHEVLRPPSFASTSERHSLGVHSRAQHAWCGTRKSVPNVPWGHGYECSHFRLPDCARIIEYWSFLKDVLKHVRTRTKVSCIILHGLDAAWAAPRGTTWAAQVGMTFGAQAPPPPSGLDVHECSRRSSYSRFPRAASRTWPLPRRRGDR